MRDRIGPDVLAPAERRAHRTIVVAVALVLVPLLLWPAVGSLVWAARSWSDLDVVAYDLTVFDDTYREHRAFAYALDANKVRFSLETDYVGSAPGGAPFGMWPAERPDLVALLDAYGVYADDQGRIDEQGRHRVSGRFSVDDARTVIGWAVDGTAVYGEMSLLQPPTEPDAIALLSGLFSVQPTGWVGRWFPALEQVPESLRPGSWPYEGPGLVLIRGDQMVVVDDAGPPVAAGTLPDGTSFSVPLRTWFEVVTTAIKPDAVLVFDSSATVESSLVINGIPREIPLIIRTGRTVYMAADASDEPVAFILRNVAGGAAFMRAVPDMSGTAFYYHVYVPLMDWLIAQAGGRPTGTMRPR